MSNEQYYTTPREPLGGACDPYGPMDYIDWHVDYQTRNQIKLVYFRTDTQV